MSPGDAGPIDSPADGEATLSRRRLLRAGGSAGLAAVVSACANWTVSDPSTVAETSAPPVSTAPSPSPPGPTVHNDDRAPSPLDATTDPGPSTASEPGAPTQPETTPLETTQPEPQPEATSTSGVAGAGVLLCRDAWGARAPRAGGVSHTITRMTLHHTAVRLDDNRNITARLRQHQRYHQDELGWVDIAYHVGVDRNGNVFELRTPDIAGDTATSYDPTGHFLVVCEGHFDQEQVTDAQLDGAALAFAWAAQTFAITADTLRAHRDFVPSTSCPGDDLYARIASGDLLSRINGVLASGPVDLRTVCGDEAADIVTAIENG